MLLVAVGNWVLEFCTDGFSEGDELIADELAGFIGLDGTDVVIVLNLL